MSKYLDKFRGVIGKRQSQQILKILNKQRNSGQIRSVEEFTTKLSDLMRELTSTVLQPSLKVWAAEEDTLIGIERYNFMLDRVQDDLEAAFEEANKIDEVQKSHEAIVKDVVLKNLKAGVAELESKISLLEFLNSDLNGFDTAIFSTFRESKEGRTQRDVAQSKTLFLDHRKGDLFLTTEDASIELIGERLTLPIDEIDYYPVRTIKQIFDDDSPQSELIVESPTMSLRNIIDETKGTYWAQSSLFSELKQYINIKLELDLGITREINFIEIEPILKQSLILESIHYLSDSNVVTDLGITEQDVETVTKIYIRKIATRRIILTFRNENCSQIQFEYDPNTTSLFNQTITEPVGGIDPNIKSLSNDLNDLIASSQIKEIAGIVATTKNTFSGYQFITGFDNIYIGLSTFKSRGVYVSEPLELEDIGEIGLKTVESRPYLPLGQNEIAFTDETYDNDSDNETSRKFQGSIEYWVVRQDLSDAGALLKTYVFPICPLSIERIHQERLLLTTKTSDSLTTNNLGETIFFTNRTATEGNIKVFRNGILLTDETGNSLATDGWKHYDDGDNTYDTPNNNVRMKFRIQMVAPSSTDVYTVTYNPLVSNTKNLPKEMSIYTDSDGLKIVDLVGDLSARSTTGQITVLDKPPDVVAIAKTRLYLAIILRQNTAERSITPAIEEYTFVAGYKDPNKFKE